MSATRRAAPVLLATAAGLALLASFHTSSAATSLATATSGAATEPTLAASTTTTTTKRAPASTTPTTLPVRTLVGPTITTKWGPVQVRATLQGTRILDVQALQLPSSHPRSNEISQQAAPLLRSEALQAQSAHINILSGASYTSVGYANSLQGALDAASTP